MKEQLYEFLVGLESHNVREGGLYTSASQKIGSL